MTPETATMVTTERQQFGREVYNLWIDNSNNLMWVATMDDVYAYKIEQQKDGVFHLTTHDIQGLPKGKKLINKLYADKRGNVWVPGNSPHTFILSKSPSGNTIHRDEVPSMTKQMGYKIMVNGIAPEDGCYWIYQNRTRLSLYDPATGRLSFMANEAFPTPLSTQKPLSRCKTQQGVWTCNGKKLIHAWHEGMDIHWEEVEEALMPNYISALSDEGNGRLLIGTEKQVFLYDYKKKKVKQLTDSVGIIQQVSSPRAGRFVFDNWHMTRSKEAVFTTVPKAPKVMTDRRGHVWTLNELTLEERNPKTGAYRVLNASDPNISMDYFTEITLAGDSICLGGIGAFCLIGSCQELDKVHPDDRIIVTHDDTLRSISVSTMNHLHAANIQFAYRWDEAEEWTELPVGENTIDFSGVGHGAHVLWVKATDEFGVWHSEQEVFHFFLPLPWYLRWWAWVGYVVVLMVLTLWVKWELKKKKEVEMDVKEELEERKEDNTTPDSPFLQKVDALVQKNLDNSDYNVNELSRDLGMSRMNMYRKFQSLSLPTPSDYMKMYRLKKAMELLKSSTASITEIAYKVGFSTPQYFAKCFKDTYGVTPREVSRGVS
jgi:AraC-like DNA-binding protein